MNHFQLKQSVQGPQADVSLLARREGYPNRPPEKSIGEQGATHPFGAVIQAFLATQRRMYDVASSDNHRYTLSQFFLWIEGRHTLVSEITITCVEEFLNEKRRLGLKPRSIASICCALRAFFRYAAAQGLCKPTIARSIKNPPLPTLGESPVGPSWKDVHRLLTCPTNGTPAELRGTAILFLCATYALRSIEIRRLEITDFDWVNETLIVRRAKSGPIQQFPIQYEAGEAVLKYLRHCRPCCSDKRLFVTLKPPYRPMSAGVITSLVRRRMQKLGIDTARYGPHALRHSCATELIRQGSSLREIASFLGHRTIRSVSVYANLNKRALRNVANFSLAGIR
jgi:integrase/recombinase XerD